MTYIITEFENTTYGGCFIVYRTDDLVRWLDKVQELKAQYHLKKSRCAFWQHTRIDGSGYTFFSFARHPLKRPDDRQKDLPFCRRPDFFWEGFPEGDE